MEKRPARKSMTQIAATLTCSSQTHPYASTDSGKKGMKYNVLCKRICITKKMREMFFAGTRQEKTVPLRCSCRRYVL